MSPLPESPSDVPRDEDVRIVLTDQTLTGQDVVWKDADGTVREFFK